MRKQALPYKRFKQLAVAIILCLGSLYFLNGFFNPRDEVAITIRGVPPNTRKLCIVAKTSNGLVPMDWYVSKVFTFPIHPAECTVSVYFPEASAEFKARVRWISSEEAGVAFKNTDGDWSISWFEAANARPAWAWWFVGGGEWSAHISEADREETLSKEQVKCLGF
jgi:hypothetical protein